MAPALSVLIAERISEERMLRRICYFSVTYKLSFSSCSSYLLPHNCYCTGMTKRYILCFVIAGEGMAFPSTKTSDSEMIDKQP